MEGKGLVTSCLSLSLSLSLSPNSINTVPPISRSVGLLMWELIEGETPFHDVANLDGMRTPLLFCSPSSLLLPLFSSLSLLLLLPIFSSLSLCPPSSLLFLYAPPLLFFFFITLGLEMSDTQVYEPYIRDLHGTTSQYSEVSACPLDSQLKRPLFNLQLY